MVVKADQYRVIAVYALCTLLIVSGCGDGGRATGRNGNEQANGVQGAAQAPIPLSIPDLPAAELGTGRRLQVAATTSVIGDVVSHIGRDRIDLIVLMQAGQDPHSYEPSAQELAAVALADVTLVNGWDLEAGLLDDLRQVAEKGPVIPVSANVVPLASSEGIDPHVWLNPHNVLIWTDNLEQILGALDPGGASEYRQNGLGYRAELRSLLTYIDEQIGSIDPTDRVMVTNHDALGHFAVQYGFEIVGTILPALDSMSEPSAGELSQLVEQLTRADVCAIYTEHTASDRLAKATAAELDGCESVALIPLYTGALGPVGSQADSYIGMMRQNVEAIVAGQNEGTE